MKKSCNLTSKNYSIFYTCNDDEENSDTDNDDQNYVSVTKLQKPRKNYMQQSLDYYKNFNRKTDHSFEDKKSPSLFKTNINFHNNNPFHSKNNSNNNNYTMRPMKNMWLKNKNKNELYTPKKSHNSSKKKKTHEVVITPNENVIDNNDIEEIKDSVTCYICLMKVISPQMCPFCHHIACQKCLYNWFITKNNHCCSFCRRVMEFDEMIAVPFMNGIANLIEKISPNESDNNRNRIITLSYEKKSNTSRKLASSKSVIKQRTLKKNCENYRKIDYCEKHKDQPLSYYCFDCDKTYCGTCFVFFGEEKDNHQTHRIMDYNKYKNLNISEIKEKSDFLESKYIELNSYIKRCETIKNCYEFEKKIGEKQIQILSEKFNNYINDKINVINNTIEELKTSLFEIEKAQKDIKKFFNKIDSNTMKKSVNLDLINKLNNVTSTKYLNSREIDNYNDMEKKLKFDIYYTIIKKFEIKEKYYHFSLNFDNSIYKLSITKKANEVQIYMYWPEEMEEDTKNIRVPIIFLRRKNRNWESFRLLEELKYKGNNYFIKRFNINNFCGVNSYFKIKGIMYEIVYE